MAKNYAALIGKLMRKYGKMEKFSVVEGVPVDELESVNRQRSKGKRTRGNSGELGSQ